MQEELGSMPSTMPQSSQETPQKFIRNNLIYISINMKLMERGFSHSTEHCSAAQRKTREAQGKQDTSRNCGIGAAEMQWFRELAASVEDPGLNPRVHMAV